MSGFVELAPLACKRGLADGRSLFWPVFPSDETELQSFCSLNASHLNGALSSERNDLDVPVPTVPQVVAFQRVIKTSYLFALRAHSN